MCDELSAVSWFVAWFFFFKQKTAYEMLRSLVGSERCIRDRLQGAGDFQISQVDGANGGNVIFDAESPAVTWNSCLLYTSDAADDLLCVDLGGRRIIKKKNSVL